MPFHCFSLLANGSAKLASDRGLVQWDSLLDDGMCEVSRYEQLFEMEPDRGTVGMPTLDMLWTFSSNSVSTGTAVVTKASFPS